MFDVKTFDIKTYHRILDAGLSGGLGERGSQVCIEAAICQALGLPHGDDPGCVAESVRSFKIMLNDARWSSPQARAEGLRKLGLAQLGSLGVVSDTEFTKRIAEKTIRILIPKLFREIFHNNPSCLEAAACCEKEGTAAAAAAARAARAAWASASGASASAAAAVRAARAAWAAEAASGARASAAAAVPAAR